MMPVETQECRTRHEDAGAVCLCDKPAGNHRLCSGFNDRAGGFVDWPNPSWVAPRSLESSSAEAKVRELAVKIQGGVRPAPSWTSVEQVLVESAITEVARSRLEFTVDHIWAVLGDQVSKTTGMASMLRRASAKGIIHATDRYADSTRVDRDDHDHGRRLRVWRSLTR